MPALPGWRRAMFGEQALKLKRGEIALAFEDGRVVAIARETPAKSQGTAS